MAGAWLRGRRRGMPRWSATNGRAVRCSRAPLANRASGRGSGQSRVIPSAANYPPRNSMTSIVDSSQYLFTSESVTEGHPDKLCDQVSDAILDAFIRADPEARVACEAATTTGLVMV